MPVKKFQLTQHAAEMASYYKENGYVVIENCINDDDINQFLTAYERTKRSRTFVYYSQSIHKWIKPQLSSAGYIVESFENATRLVNAPSFAQAIKKILFHEKISEALTAVSGFEQFVSWQDMFFDRSTGTIDHQDSWYLDTRPNGYLVGAWYALEDIHPECGPFYVYPKSHALPRLERHLDHDEFRKKSLDQITAAKITKEKAMLRKGDLLLWHPFLLHGSESCENEAHSRKSFTSHFFPLGFARDMKGETSSPVEVLRRDLNRLEPTFNRNIFQIHDVNPYIFTGKGILKALLQNREAIKDMRRSSYE
ncbi:MAG: hypothetical protein CMH56_15390 [Myxococcales bacterium]|nr:hypothetical protein [Myxococcales bacterium]